MSWVHADWTWRVLSPLLADDDAQRLALCALDAGHRSLWRFLVFYDDAAGARRPLNATRLLQLAVAHGCWRAAQTVHHELLRHRHTERNGDVLSSDLQALRDQLARQNHQIPTAMVSFIRRVQHAPVQIPPQVIYAACQHGQLDAVAWLHQVGEYEPHVALEWAAKSRHMEVVRWLLTHRKTALSLHPDIKISWTLKGKEAKALGGFYAWNVAIPDQRATYGYCASKQHGLLPRKNLKNLKTMYPLKSWAALRGELTLLQKLFESPCGRELSTADAVTRAAEHGHLHIVQWFFELERPLHKVIEDVTLAALTHGQLEIVQWLHEMDFDVEFPVESRVTVRAGGFTKVDEWLEETFPDPKLVAKLQKERNLRWSSYVVDAAGNGLLEAVRFLVEDVGFDVMPRAYGDAAQNGHKEVLMWLMEHSPPSEPDVRFILTRAVIGGSLCVVEWLVESCGLWDSDLFKFAAVENQLHVAHYLYRLAQDQATRENVPVAMLVNVNIDLVYLISKGFFEVLRWLLDNVTDAVLLGQNFTRFRFFLTLERYHDENAAALQMRNEEFDHTRHYQWALAAHQPRDRVVQAVRDVVSALPASVCRRLEWVPEWAIKTASRDILEALASMQHPELFTDQSFCVLLRSARDPSLVQWFVEQEEAAFLVEDSITKLIQWAARGSHIELLHWIFSRSEALATFRTAVWSAATYGNVSVLQAVARQLEFRGLTVQEEFCRRIWQFVDCVATESGHINVIEWVWSKTNARRSQLADVAAKRGQLRVLQWLARVSPGSEQCSTRGLRQALGNGHADILAWLLRHSPRMVEQAMEESPSLDAAVKSLLAHWKDE